MKICPFCAEEIQDAAIVCKHCGRDLDVGQGIRLAPMMWVAASLALAISLAFLLFFDTTVQTDPVQLWGTAIGGGRVNNLGLMADRQNGIVAFGFLAVIAAAAAFAARRRRMSRRMAIGSVIAAGLSLVVAIELTIGFTGLWVLFVIKVFG